MNGLALREGPYYYAIKEHRKTREANGKTFTLIASTAFNAGIIGPECNGIVVLNDTDLQVVLDEECREASGYFGPSAQQLFRFDELLAMPDAEFLAFCRGHKRFRGEHALGPVPLDPIPAKFDCEASASYNAENKAMFHRWAQHRLGEVARHMGLKRDDYDLRHNQGGIAVSGEITLHTDNLYVQVSQSAMGSNSGILYRTCKHRKDYSGGMNNFAPLAYLDDPATLAVRFKRLLDRVTA